MSTEQKAEIDFVEWLGMVCKHEPLAYQRLLCAGLLMICTSFLMMHNAVVGLLLFIGLGVAFTWAFRRAWLRSMENPPWYLKHRGLPPWVAFSPNPTASLKAEGERDAKADDD